MAGIYSVTNTSNLGCSFSDTIQVSLMVCTTDVIENNLEGFVVAYPSPFTETLTIETTIENAFLTLTDIEGRIVYSNVLIKNKVSLDLFELSSGPYLLSVKSKDLVYRKLVVKD